jgi:hypothetical protein
LYFLIKYLELITKLQNNRSTKNIDDVLSDYCSKILQEVRKWGTVLCNFDNTISLQRGMSDTNNVTTGLQSIQCCESTSVVAKNNKFNPENWNFQNDIFAGCKITCWKKPKLVSFACQWQPHQDHLSRQQKVKTS